MARQRNYKAEYAHRIARGKKRGLSRSQARGHARPSERGIRDAPIQSDNGLEAALRSMRNNQTQLQAAKDAGVSVERLRRFLYRNHLAKHDRGKWQFSDNRIREMTAIAQGQMRQMRFEGYDSASLNGQYLNAVKAFILTNNSDKLADFVGQSFRDAKGKRHNFETDPNELYRLYQSGDDVFEVYYKTIT